jgi:hypothetical protein
VKFNCGLTREDAVSERYERRKKYEAKLAEWHDYFTWRPIKIKSHDCRWLETIERRRRFINSDFASYWKTEYRSKK